MSNQGQVLKWGDKGIEKWESAITKYPDRIQNAINLHINQLESTKVAIEQLLEMQEEKKEAAPAGAPGMGGDFDY